MSSNNIDPQILANMKTHYSGLMKVGTTDFGGDLMSKAILIWLTPIKATV